MLDLQGTAWDPMAKYMATQSSDRSCRVYQVAQSTPDGGGQGTTGTGGLTVKCCNVIKSCVVSPDDEGGGGLAGGDAPRFRHDVLAPHDAVAKAKISAASAETTGVGTTPTRTEGEKGSCTKAETIALTDCSNDAIGVPDMEARHAAHERGDDDAERKGCPNKKIACASDADSSKDKTKPVQRKNLFVDETVTSFFRRLSWSPDGAFLITPTAQSWATTTRKTQFCTYLFVRGQFVK